MDIVWYLKFVLKAQISSNNWWFRHAINITCFKPINTIQWVWVSTHLQHATSQAIFFPTFDLVHKATLAVINHLLETSVTNGYQDSNHPIQSIQYFFKSVYSW